MNKLIKTFVRKIAPNRLYEFFSDRINRIYFVSYPKCGRTWLRVLIGQSFIESRELSGVNPIDYATLKEIDSTFPKISVTHAGRPAWLPPEQIDIPERIFGNKVLLLVRDPRDVVVSLYYHMKHRNNSYDGSLKDFLYQKNGSIDSIIKYYNLFISNKERFEKLTIVKYEDLLSQPLQALKTVTNFLFEKEIDDQHLKKAIEFGAFEKMKKRESTSQQAIDGFDPLNPVDLNESNSFKARKGKSGGYLNEFEPPEIIYINSKIEKSLHKSFGY